VRCRPAGGRAGAREEPGRGEPCWRVCALACPDKVHTTELAGARNKGRPRRTTPIAIRFCQFTLARLKALAELRNTGYQTLLKQFVVERLYEEEKREGII
jgi:hypothetical protein